MFLTPDEMRVSIFIFLRSQRLIDYYRYNPTTERSRKEDYLEFASSCANVFPETLDPLWIPRRQRH